MEKKEKVGKKGGRGFYRKPRELSSYDKKITSGSTKGNQFAWEEPST